MAGDFGKLKTEAYGHNIMTQARASELEVAVSAWLANKKPGAFTSRDACGLYDAALKKFEACSGWSHGHDARNFFEIALARLGYRAGVGVYDGEPFWFLLLPSSMDTALTRLAEVEVRSA